MVSFLKIFGLLLLSATKFLFAPGVIRASGYTFFESIAISTIGGIIGVFTFYFLGKWITKKMDQIFQSKAKKKFTHFNRTIVKIKHKFGLIGIVTVTPCMISIPIGCILTSKYFRHDKRALPFLFLSLFFWAVVLNSLVYVVELDFLM